MSAKAKHIGNHVNVLNRMVDPRDLSLNPENERTYRADAPENVALRQSIRAQGVLQPLRIYSDGVVEDGNRRLYNIQILLNEGVEIKEVPAVLVERPATEAEGVILRLNLNEAQQFAPLEQGRAFAKLRAAGMNDVQIANATGFKSMHVGNMLTLHNASETIHQLVDEGKISATMAVTVLRAHGEEMIHRMVDFALSQGKAKATERHLDALLAQDKAAATPVEDLPAPAPAATEAVAVEVQSELPPIAPATDATGAAEVIEEIPPPALGAVEEIDPSQLSDELPSHPMVTEEVNIPAPQTNPFEGEDEGNEDPGPLPSVSEILGVPTAMVTTDHGPSANVLKAFLMDLLGPAREFIDARDSGTDAEFAEAAVDFTERLREWVDMVEAAGIVAPEDIDA